MKGVFNVTTQLFATTNANIRHYNVPWFMYLVIVLALIGYALIEAYNTRQDQVISFKRAVQWSAFYISIALAFSVLVFICISSQAGVEYLAAWGIEKALSLDNLFVIGLIFTSLKVDPRLERRMLNYGIAGAIVFRLIFILAGVELLTRFEWISIIFGLVLLRAAWKTFQEARAGNEKKEAGIANKKMWQTLRRILPIHSEFDGHKLTTKVNGKRMLTMMAGAIIMIELTDILFAVDSVPAVLAVSPNRFIAYASNIFALLGLRALFFVYRAVESKFWALNWALAAVLAWIGFKMIAAPLGLNFSVGINLGVLAILLGGGVMVSLAHPKSEIVL